MSSYYLIKFEGETIYFLIFVSTIVSIRYQYLWDRLFVKYTMSKQCVELMLWIQLAEI